MTEPRWEWVDAVFGAVAGFVTGLLSLLVWVNNQIQLLHGRINQANETVRKNQSEQAVQIATLTTQQEANQQFQQRVDAALAALQTKNDEQLRILSRLDGSLMHKSRGQ